MSSDSPRTPTDAPETDAKETLRGIWESDRLRVCYSRQLEVIYEGTWFHWITNRALRDLAEEGFLKMEPRTLANGGRLHLYWHKTNRYPRRAADRVARLVEDYSADEVSEALGNRGEQLVLEGLATRQFVLHGRSTRTFRGQAWTRTAHNLDFIVERDAIPYGVEVKNSLDYIDGDELDLKMDLCAHLGVKPVFVVRAMPRTWTHDVIQRGGFVLILRYQLYPPLLKDLVGRIRAELGLPVDHPKSLSTGTMDRFVNWHEKHVL